MERQTREEEMLQSQSQNCSSRCRTVKPKLEEEKSTTMEKTEDDATLTLTHNNANDKVRAIFVVENASLTKGFVRKRWKILDSEEDADFLLKQKKDLNDFRPGRVYEALRAILDSKLNKAGMVGAVYVKTDQGVLFEIKPHVRIPRTCKRFCGVILELLGHKCIRDKDTNEILMRVIEEPVTRHLPVNSRVVGLSYSSEKLVDIDEYVNSGSDELNLVFVVGAMVHGKISKEYTDDFISVSNYPLSAQYCVGLICESLEHKWKSSE
ncbi:unnamed protein product [Prunus armeniaca]|uniref:Ribosomal RNA small subunit methyltransferase NEP1 n=1 Tax=Prunus armeniaca TaxID=36596 RepID=A0A6J5TWQ3_PRUAR|nr:unnamed protein product [Prunus armeniaca]